MTIRAQSDGGELPLPIIEEVTDPVEIARAEALRARFDRNIRWFKTHAEQAYAPANRGRYVCVAGEELFVADSYEEALALAGAKHPDDDAPFCRYIPPENVVYV